MILDKLMEKKDLLSFIEFRIRKLNLEIEKQLKLPEKKRHSAWKQLKGRIEELNHIKKNVNNLKELSKKLSKNRIIV